MLRVAKFGGSSMADRNQYEKVKNIILSHPDRKVVVVSAAGKRFKGDNKITDLLYLCHAHIKYGVSYMPIYEMISSRLMEIKAELGLSTDIETPLAQLKEKLDSGISEDELVSRGEYFSALLMADYLGYEFLDAKEWLRFGYDGEVDKEVSYRLLKQKATGRRVVIPGFYGVMPDGKIRVFSRGGSDITGALAAAALDADIYENWTDVSGILMVDPKIVSNPLSIEKVTFEELRELSYMGAQVLHELTVFPVREKNIPINILNTNAPEDKGTLIISNEDLHEDDDRFITGITGKKNFTIISIGKTGMSNMVGALRKILTIFENHGVSIEFIPSGIDTASVVVESEKVKNNIYTIVSEIQKELECDDVQVRNDESIVAVVGRKMANRPGVSGKLLAAIGKAGINIDIILQDSSEVDVIVGVANKDFEKTIQVLYSSFVRDYQH